MTLSVAPLMVAMSASITVAGAADQPPRSTQSCGDNSVRCLRVLSSRGIGYPHSRGASGIADDHAVIRQRMRKVTPQQMAVSEPAKGVGSAAHLLGSARVPQHGIAIA